MMDDKQIPSTEVPDIDADHPIVRISPRDKQKILLIDQMTPGSTSQRSIVTEALDDYYYRVIYRYSMEDPLAADEEGNKEGSE